MSLSKINPVKTAAWKKLTKHQDQIGKTTIKELFDDPTRFESFSHKFDHFLFDFSKNRITTQTLKLLLSLAEECELPSAIEQLFTGKIINETEQRAVLHTALRDFSKTPIKVDRKDVKPEIQKVREKMQSFCMKVHDGRHTGYTKQKITQIVNIGIGGSDLGPSMVTEALKPYWLEGMELYFVSNVDGTAISECLKKLLKKRLNWFRKNL